MDIQTKRPYIHFKGKLYYVHDIVQHSETKELLVSYQCLYPPYSTHVRPLEMFTEEIDQNREDNITGQKHRFELFEGILTVKCKCGGCNK